MLYMGIYWYTLCPRIRQRHREFIGLQTLVVEGPTVVVVSPPESSPPSMWRKIRPCNLQFAALKQAQSWTKSIIEC